MQPPGTPHHFGAEFSCSPPSRSASAWRTPQMHSQGPRLQVGEVLPIQPPKQEPITELDYRKVTPPPRFEVRPPPGAPNVVIVLMDQLCYADPATFGGPIRMPTLDRLAEERPDLHQLPRQRPVLADPHRPADRAQQHQCSMAAVVDAGTGLPRRHGRAAGQLRHRSARSCAAGATSPRYFGKCHEVPPYEVSVSGPFDRWPAHTGWDKFYGYLGGRAVLASTRT